MGLSDHRRVYSFLCKSIKHHEAKTMNCRSTKNLSLNDIKKDLKETDLLLSTATDVDTLYAHWRSKVMAVVDKHLPVKKMRVRKVDAPYMNTEWKATIRKKRRYSKKFSKDRSYESWELMRKWRNEAIRLRRKAIKSYWKEVSQELNNNPRKFCSTFKPFLNAKSKDRPEICLETHGKILQDHHEVAEEFTSYFSPVADAIGGDRAKNLCEDVCSQYPSVKRISARIDASPFNFNEIMKEDVLKALNTMNPHKAM